MDIRTKRNLFILLFLDIILIISSFTLSILLRFDFSLPVDVISMINLGNIFGVISIKLSFFVLFALYNGMWRYTSVWDMLNIIKANLSASFIIIIINKITIILIERVFLFKIDIKIFYPIRVIRF